MDYKKTMEYLSILLDMEKNIYIQEKTIENLYAERNSLGIKNRIELPIPESASTDYFDYMVTTGFVFWIIGLIIIIIAKWKDFWESSGIFAIIIVPIIAGIIALFIGLAGALIIGPFVAAHYKSKEQNNLDAQYKYQLDEYNKLCDAEEKRIKNENVIRAKIQQEITILENKYNDAEKEHNELMESLNSAYSNRQLQMIKESEEIQHDLDKIRATRAAAIKAQTKEKEIKEQLSFYCLNPTENEINDIIRLERIKPDLHNPRVLSMLIWSTFFQKPMTALCNNILGTSVVTGIYKITNQKDNCCYIGQAIDVAKRWKEHAKCGLDIDTPAGNKLYKAMKKDGIWNFSWELLETCPKDQLNEKERFYIELYQSKEYGYNSSAGNK